MQSAATREMSRLGARKRKHSFFIDGARVRIDSHRPSQIRYSRCSNTRPELQGIPEGADDVMAWVAALRRVLHRQRQLSRDDVLSTSVGLSCFDAILNSNLRR